MNCEEMIRSDEYIDVLVDPIALQEYSEVLGADICYQPITGQIGILYIERSRIPSLRISDSVYAYFPKIYGLMSNGSNEFDPSSLIDAGIFSVQNPPLNLTGRGVTIGFIDTGIDYKNPVFQTEDGRTRIDGIWDQTIEDGNIPDGFLFGSEYTRDEIQRALDSEVPDTIVPSKDENGHGTSMASVAAGSKLQGDTTFVGAAPDARIVMVKLKQAKQSIRNEYFIKDGVPCYMESDLIQGIKYLQKYAVEYVKPLVICIGVGTNLGDHTGSGVLGDYLRQLTLAKSKALVVAGGNEGNAEHHYRGEYIGNESLKKIELRVGEQEPGFVMELWGKSPYQFSIVIKSPGGEVVAPIFTPRQRASEYTFVFEETKLIIDYLLIESNSGKEYIRISFQKPTAGIWTIEVTKKSDLQGGTIDAWLPIVPFVSNDTYFLLPQPNITLVEPGNVEGVLTVSSYDSGNNSFSITSGRGFTANNRKKPDIAAPGVNVSTIKGKESGSSMAAALTVGGVAQIMEWAVVRENDLFIDGRKVKNYMIRGASRQDNREYPNREWGFGTLDIAGVFRWIAGV